MRWSLSERQAHEQRRFRALCERSLTPCAAAFDHDGRVPRELLAELAQAGVLGASVPREYGGSELDAVTYGLMCEQLGAASASVLSLVTVHNMVAEAIARWGSGGQKERWLPRLARGETFAAFCLSEPDIGSDAGAVQTRAERASDGFTLTGTKTWASGAQLADLFWVLARSEQGPCAVLVERAKDGVRVEPIADMLGFRGAMLGRVEFSHCRLASEAIVGRPGLGFSFVAASALDRGRLSIAWGALGLMQAALDQSLAYTQERAQFGRKLQEHALVQRTLTEMLTDTQAARGLCFWASRARDEANDEAVAASSLAKYFSARAAVRSASRAVQLHGANGFSSTYPVARYLRDAKVFELIEGSNEMQQLMLWQASAQLNGYE